MTQQSEPATLSQVIEGLSKRAQKAAKSLGCGWKMQSMSGIEFPVVTMSVDEAEKLAKEKKAINTAIEALRDIVDVEFQDVGRGLALEALEKMGEKLEPPKPDTEPLFGDYTQ